MKKSILSRFFLTLVVCMLCSCQNLDADIQQCLNERMAYQTKMEKAKTSDSNKIKYLKKTESYNEKLVELGYFQYKRIDFKKIKYLSDDYKRFYTEFTKGTTFEKSYYISGIIDGKHSIEIWATKPIMKKALKIIKKHDQ